jgi:hypothetical protein|tara:strand:- start:105 stop:1109 length:1005 start_codon:yes stop_codon:yes gene_type:complete
MNQARRISQAVSVAPVMIVLIILFMGGLGIGPTTLGSWFFVTEDFQYTDADSDALSNLVEKSHYNYYFEEADVVQYAATEGPDLGASTESTISYSETGYELRSPVFYNISLLFYAALFISILSSVLLFVLDYFWKDIVKSKLVPSLRKNDVLGVIFGGYAAVIVFALFVGVYTVMAVPDAMHQDHLGWEKECLYPNDMTIGGSSVCGESEGDIKYFDGKEAILNSKWTFGPGFILFLSGVLGPSLYLLSTTYSRFEAESERISSIPQDPELFFDADAKLLFDINTGEVLGSFQYEGEDRNLFFDEDAMILWDEDTGDVLYGGPSDDETESTTDI